MNLQHIKSTLENELPSKYKIILLNDNLSPVQVQAMTHHIVYKDDIILLTHSYKTLLARFFPVPKNNFTLYHKDEYSSHSDLSKITILSIKKFLEKDFCCVICLNNDPLLSTRCSDCATNYCNSCLADLIEVTPWCAVCKKPFDENYI